LRPAGSPPRPWPGIAAALVQVTGLSRWVLFVPGLSHDALIPAHRQDAYHRFQLLHTWLGTVIGETIGYALTAVFTVLVVRAVTRTRAPRWMAYLGYAAALIATGVVVPLGLDIARLTNFAGYVSWCAWLVAMAVVLWRATRAVWVAIPGAVHGESSTVKRGKLTMYIGIGTVVVIVIIVIIVLALRR
jgi:hypothetical protein